MKKIIMILIIIFLIIISVVYYFIFSKNGNSSKEEMDEIPTPTIILPTVSENIKVNLTASANGRAISLKISEIPPSIESIEYELIYITGAGLPRGVNGKIILKDESDVLRDNITLGSCSSGGKCTYDEGVTSVDLTLKFNTNSVSSIFQKTFPI